MALSFSVSSFTFWSRLRVKMRMLPLARNVVMCSALAAAEYETSAAVRIAADTEEQRAESAERRRLEVDLRHAVVHGKLALHFQPRFSLGSGQPLGAEALLRWPHRKRGLIAPSAFLPYAERSGLINRIGGWVLGQGCAEARGWPSGLRLSINVAARQLSDGVLLEQVGQALQSEGLSPEQLELEVPESVLLEGSESMLFTLAALRDIGVGLALDDFGAGATSLGTLRRLPFSAVKLDRGLIRGLPDQAEDVTIVRAVIDTAHVLGLAVIAAGVETPAQRDFLSHYGCDEAQGHL
jgi:EAL domain-containing protein (putative c-di-GMP-specific phosphodiesterase class I)